MVLNTLRAINVSVVIYPSVMTIFILIKAHHQFQHGGCFKILINELLRMVMLILYKEHGHIPEPTGVINEICKEQLINYITDFTETSIFRPQPWSVGSWLH